MQKKEDLDTPFPEKTNCRYKIPEEFLESETWIANCFSYSLTYFSHLPIYSSANRNNHSASRKCQ